MSKIIAIFLVVLLASRVAADPLPSPHVRITNGEGELITYEGKHYVLPLGTHIFTYEMWEELDTEFRRLQDQETRLTAENKSLKKSADEWRPGWKIVVAGALLGLAAGVYVGMKY